MLHLLYVCECMWNRLLVWNVSYWLNTNFPLTLPLFPLLPMLNSCFCSSLVWMYHFLARRSFACVTITHLHQTTACSSSSSSSFSFHWNFFAHQNQHCSFPPLICPHFFHLTHLSIISVKGNHLFASDQCVSSQPPFSFLSSPYSLSLQIQHYSFLWMKYSHQTMDHFFSPFLSLIPSTPSFVTCISCALLSLWLLQAITNSHKFVLIIISHLHMDI